MTKKPTDQERLDMLNDSIAIDIMTMTDEEALTLAESAFGSAENIAVQFDGIIKQAATNVAKKKFVAARSKLEKAKNFNQTHNLTSLPLDRKKDILEMIQRNSSIPTMAARNAINSENDIDSLLEDLVELGIIDEKGNAL